MQEAAAAAPPRGKRKCYCGATLQLPMPALSRQLAGRGLRRRASLQGRPKDDEQGAVPEDDERGEVKESACEWSTPA